MSVAYAQPETETWKTKDMGLAAYLSLTEPVLRTEWDGRDCFWIFNETDELVDLLLEYTSERGSVEPKRLLEQYKILSGRLRSELRRSRT